MALPDQELFTIEDVASRYGKTVGWVRDMIRSRKLRPYLDFSKFYADRKPEREEPLITIDELKRFELETEEAPLDLFEAAKQQPGSQLWKICYAAHRRFFRDGSFRARLPHKQQIAKWINENWQKCVTEEGFKLSKNDAERIAIILNDSKASGRPRSNQK